MAEYDGMRVEIDTHQANYYEPILVSELAEFLRYFRAAYVAVLTESHISNEDPMFSGQYDRIDMNEARALARKVKETAPFRGTWFLQLSNTHVPVELRIARMSMQSPLHMALTGIPLALAAAVIISGGEFTLTGVVKVKLPALGVGITKLREAFGMKAQKRRVVRTPRRHKRSAPPDESES